MKPMERSPEACAGLASDGPELAVLGASSFLAHDASAPSMTKGAKPSSNLRETKGVERGRRTLRFIPSCLTPIVSLMCRVLVRLVQASTFASLLLSVGPQFRLPVGPRPHLRPILFVGGAPAPPWALVGLLLPEGRPVA